MNETNFSFVPTSPEPIQRIAPEVAVSILQGISQERIGWIAPLRLALAQLTTPEVFQWYGTQAKATAALAYTIATKAKHLLKPTSALARQSPTEAELRRLAAVAWRSHWLNCWLKLLRAVANP
jgi:hypothetical protein